MIADSNPKKHPTIPTPSVINRWRFGDLCAADLLPHLQRHLSAGDANVHWQLVWLNDNGHPVIGLLPKVSWSVYFEPQPQSRPNATEPIYTVIKTCRDSIDNIKSTSTTTNMSYGDWQDELIAYSQNYKNDSKTIIKGINQPTYHHGLMGYIGYDIAAHELSPTSAIQQQTQPSAVLGHYDIYLTPAYNTDVKTGWLLTTSSSNNDNDIRNKHLTQLVSYLNRLDAALAHKDVPLATLAPLILTPRWQKNDYQQAFAQTQHYLVQGDCYQINLTQAWQGTLHKTNDDKAPKLLDYLPSLHANTQAPFAGYIALPPLKNKRNDSVDFELLSCSPELFFTFIKNHNTNTHHIITKPIKGTMPRGNNIEQDLALKQQLIASDKDRSENVMIVDLLRNDLGKYAKVGSVKVPQLFAIESFSNVHHMVSTISAELKADVHPLKVLFGSLPAGSITGTPKKRAVEIIAELEGAARGAYCGTLGYMNFDGSGQWNVLIRTLQASTDTNDKKQVCLWAGGGITIASSCASEYQECLDKVGNLLTVLAQADNNN